MKKLLLPLFFILTVSFSFSQDISGPKPILTVGGQNITPDVSSFTLGCGTPAMTVTANYVYNLGSPDSYRVEQVSFHEKSYLPVSGGAVLTPAQLGVPGQMISNLSDDTWSSTQQLASGGSNLEFCYFGQSKTQFVVSSNGMISFDTSYANNYSSWTVHTMGKIEPNANCGDGTSGNNDTILQFHDTNPADSDADFESYMFWAISGIEHERFLNMGTHHMPMFSCGADFGYATHQALFYETTNIIEFNIRDKPLCDTWANGWQAFGLQNNGSTEGIAVPGLDNQTQYQILNQADPYSASHSNPAAPVHDSVSYRFVPDGVNGVTPVFAWYKNWDSTTNTGTLVTNSYDLTVQDTDLPFDANGDPIPVTYTAVVTYVEYCSGVTYHATNNVTFEAIPVRMHIVENNAPDPNVETIDVEEIKLCEGEDYLLQANVFSNNPNVNYTIEWTVESFGNPATVIDDGDGDPLTYLISNASNPPDTYVYTCTLTATGAVNCVFSDQVAVTVISEPTMNYPAPQVYCANDDTNPLPENVFPVPENNASPEEIASYYYTISIGGNTINHTDPDPSLDANKNIWADSLDMVPIANQDDPSNPDWSEHSLSGEVNLSFAYQYAKDNNLLNNDNEAEVIITYHAHCPQNIVTEDIIIRDAPLVLNPADGDTTASPIVIPSPLINECETNSNLHTADFLIRGYTDGTTGEYIPGIEDYIANGTPLTDLNFEWESQTGGIVLQSPMPDTYTTTAITVKVTVTLVSDTAACPKELLFDLTPITAQVATTPSSGNYIVQCERIVGGVGQNEAEFLYNSIKNEILSLVSPTDLPNCEVVFEAFTVADDGTETPYTLPDFETETPPFYLPSLKFIAKIKNIYNTYIDPNTGNIYIDPSTGEEAIYYCYSNEVTFNFEVRDIAEVTVPSSVGVTTPTVDDAILELCVQDISTNTANFDTSTWNTIVLSANTDIIETPPNLEVIYEYTDIFGNTQIRNDSTPLENPLTFDEGIHQIKVKIINHNNNQSCTSIEKSFNVIVHPKPVEVPQAPVIICSDDTTSINLTTYTTLTNNTYEWVSTDNPDVTGETLTTSTTATITDTLHNVSLTDQTVTYTITPTADTTNGNCTGDSFTIDVTVHPEPVGTDTPVLTCSDVEASIDLNTITTLTGNTYSWVVTDNPDVTGETTGTQTGNMITQTLTNTSTTNQDVVYTVTPTSANGCVGEDFTVTISVGVEPIGTDPNITTCSDVALAIDLDDAAITTLTGNTFSWVANDNPNVQGETVGASTNGMITDSLTNTTLVAQVVTYTVTPTSANGCLGNDFTVTVNVNPEPVQIAQGETTCSNVALAIDLNTYTSLSGNTYQWYADANANVGGVTTATQTGANITDTLTNTTVLSETVTYHITATSANGCAGDEFTIDIIVNPEPVGTDTPVLTCSDVEASIDLNTITTLTGNTYSWVVTDNPNVTGETTGTQTGNMITQTLTNTGTTNQDVIYTVTPTSADGCVGEDFTVTINVGVEPIGTDPNVTVCSYNSNNATSLNIDLDGTAITTLTGNTFSWLATDNPNVTGETLTASTAGFITDNLTNTSNAAQTVVYTVTPTSANSCLGNNFTVTVTVNPEPKAPASTPENACSDVALSLDLNSYITNLTTNDNTFSWTAVANGTVTGFTASGTTDTITDTITNTSGASVDVTYTVTPTSVAGCVGENFDIVVTVGDEPVGTDTTLSMCSDDSLSVDLNTLVSKTGTTFAWTSATNGTVTGVTASGASANITDTINNVSNVPVEVTYTITPTNGCVGNDFTVIVTVNPEPVGTPPATLDACSDVEFTINLEDHTSMSNAGNTYEWQAIDNTDVGVTGETTTLTTSNTIVETITNVSASPQIVSYEVTPISANGCRGNLFTIDVEVGQKPVELTNPPVLTPYCSKDVLNIDLNTFTTLTGNTYEWIATDNADTNTDGNATVTGETLTLTAGSTITDAIQNTSDAVQQVTYTITPTSANGCKGNDFTIVVDINPEPIAENVEESACSDIAVDFDLTTYTSLTNNTYEWVATDNPNVTGETLANSTATHITDTLNNVSNANQEVIYTVIPTSSEGCVGNSFEVKVTVGVEPVGDTSTIPSCSDDANFEIKLNDFITNLTSNDYTFVWYAENNNQVLGETTTNSTDNTITDTLTNTSGAVQNVVYHIIPTSAAPNSCEGDEFTITVEVGFEPVGTTTVETICNEEQLSLNLDNYTTLIGNTYKWHAIDNVNVTGETTDDTTTSSIDDTIVNTTGTVQTVEYMVTPTSAGGCEGDEFLVAVDVNPRPQFELHPQYLICPDVHEVTIGEDTNPDDYTYHWYEANDMNVIIGYDKTLLVTEADLTASNGTYVLTVIDSLGCTYSQFTSVSMAEQVVITEIHVSDFNRPNNTIQIDVTGGSGQFEYTLNYIDYAGSAQSITQNSPIFEHIVGGSYQIEVADLTGCSITTTSQDIYVLDYPPFFTPNGDLQHDTWQITGAQFIPTSKIYIFDRFGKVLAQVNPNSVIGWDGTYNGVQVPASDYWFTCEYIDPNTGEQKSVKGHFSIVRK